MSKNIFLFFLLFSFVNLHAKKPDLKQLQFSTVDGKKVVLKEIKYKALLLNFWATWCAPCLKELPSIIETWKKYHDKGFEVAAININEDPKTDLEAIAKKYPLPFLVFVDPQQKLLEKFEGVGVPFNVVINSKNQILYQQNHEEDWASSKMQQLIESWLK